MEIAPHDCQAHAHGFASTGGQLAAVLEQGFAEPEPNPLYQEISVKLKISGTLEAITRWLVEIQQPANFVVIDGSLRPFAHTPHLSAAVWTGLSHRRRRSSSSWRRGREQPAISSEVV